MRVRTVAVILSAVLSCATAAERDNNQGRQRKARQYGGKPERPRPFEPATYLPPATGYPESGARPSPPYNEGPQSTYRPPATSYQPPQSSYRPPQSSSQQPQPSYQPPQSSYRPSQSTYEPPQSNYQPPQPTNQPPQSTNQPDSGYAPTQSQPNQPPQIQTNQPPQFQPNQPPQIQPNQPPQIQTNEPSYQSTNGPYQPELTNPPQNPSTPSYEPSNGSAYVPSTNPANGQTNGNTPLESGGNGGDTGNAITPDDDDRHPPHVHEISVDCGKEQMTVNIEFNKPYNGLIYSQGFYNVPECVYVRENSNQVKFSFTLNLEMCGTKFFSDFKNEGQAYLENVLVLQNEAGFQEIWDHIRRVRCLWEGNLQKQLSSSLTVGMLNQITSNFSGDTAMARLDIQSGRGPFAQPANGLVKIGETMTLVISVTGDVGFDIQVKECVARDADSRNVVPLTDYEGCVLKPKLFGTFQKTRETGNTGASIIAYAYFNAFKFPDEMDLIIQCDVELCKTDCEMCQRPGSVNPARKRRDIVRIGNSTAEPIATVGKTLRVIFPEEVEYPEEFKSSMCLSQASFLWGAAFVLTITVTSSVCAGYFWLKVQKMKSEK